MAGVKVTLNSIGGSTGGSSGFGRMMGVLDHSGSKGSSVSGSGGTPLAGALNDAKSHIESTWVAVLTKGKQGITAENLNDLILAREKLNTAIEMLSDKFEELRGGVNMQKYGI